MVLPVTNPSSPVRCRKDVRLLPATTGFAVKTFSPASFQSPSWLKSTHASTLPAAEAGKVRDPQEVRRVLGTPAFRRTSALTPSSLHAV